LRPDVKAAGTAGRRAGSHGGERMLLFCVASGTDWQRAGITGETVTALVVKGLIERNSGGRLSLTEGGRETLRTLLPQL